MTEYEDALQYFERKRDSARKRYEAALRRGDETQALQLKVKARRMEVAVEAISIQLDMFQADIIQVVRCKDCALRKTENCAMEFHDHTDLKEYTWENDWDYCSWGERREDHETD